MKKNYIKKNLILTILLFASVFGIQAGFAGSVAASDAASNAKAGLETSANIGYGVIPFKDLTPAQIIGQVVGIGLSFIAVVFFLILLYGGFTWMMARGNEQEVEKAIGLIQAAVFGLIVVLAAYAVVAFLSDQFINANP